MSLSRDRFISTGRMSAEDKASARASEAREQKDAETRERDDKIARLRRLRETAEPPAKAPRPKR